MAVCQGADFIVMLRCWPSAMWACWFSWILLVADCASRKHLMSRCASFVMCVFW